MRIINYSRLKRHRLLLRLKRKFAWNGYCLYDGYNRTIYPRSHNAQKGDDLATDRHLLWRGNIVDYFFRLFV